VIGVAVSNISKSYPIAINGKRTRLRRQMLRHWFGLGANTNNASSDAYMRRALHEVSFNLTQGDSLAIIGRNGAGKSTLLKLIAGNLQPDSGIVEVNGKVGGLIELGSGLEPNKSGRDNALARARLLGVEKAKLDHFVKAINEFAELDDQFEDPVNSYSTGMRARLGFAISVMLPFDIMLCDEALSVGDARFAAKCLAKINDLKAERVFLFVSHSMTMVQRFCAQAIVLDKGEMVFSGSATDGVAFYENNILHMSDASIENAVDFARSQASASLTVERRSFLEPLLINREKIDHWESEFTLEGDTLRFTWSITAQGDWSDSTDYRFGFPIFASDATMLFSCTNENLNKDWPKTERTITGTLNISHHGLHPGVYYPVLAFYEGLEPILRQPLGELVIPSTGVPGFGVYNTRHQWILGKT